MADLMPTLRSALLELLFDLRHDDLPLIIGGGYGLYLKREQVRLQGMRTLLSEWPEARATNDLDLFLRPELLINPLQLKPLADTLRRLGYQPVRGAEKYQFAKPGPSGGPEGSIKIDLLTGPQSRFRETSAKVDPRRIRPRPSVDLHAHPVDEALTLEDDLLPIHPGRETRRWFEGSGGSVSAPSFDVRRDETVRVSGSGQRREQTVRLIPCTRHLRNYRHHVRNGVEPRAGITQASSGERADQRSRTNCRPVFRHTESPGNGPNARKSLLS